MTQYKAYARIFTLSAVAAAVSALAACAAPEPKASDTYALSVPPRAEPGIDTQTLQDTAPPEGGYTPVASVADARAASPQLGLREDAPLRYVVKKGDTLWDISKKFLADAWQWPELWYVNGKIANPHLIYPGDVLELAYVNGRPVLTRGGGGGLERVSPQIRSSSLDEALPAIPIDAIRNFLRGPRLVDADTLNKAPYILSFTDDHLMGAINDGIYIKALPPQSASAWSVVRKGEQYRDPETKEVLGYEALPTGETEIRDFGTPAEGVLSKSFREVLRGDRLLPMESENFEANFYPHSPANPVNARIISVFDGVSQITQYQIVTLNRGSLHGLEPGHVLTIFQAGRSVVDPYTNKREKLPEQNAGLLMVFKVTPKLSYGLVMTATRPVHVLDRAEKPNHNR